MQRCSILQILYLSIILRKNSLNFIITIPVRKSLMEGFFGKSCLLTYSDGALFRSLVNGLIPVQFYSHTMFYRNFLGLILGRLLENLIQERTKSGVSHLSVVYFGDGKNDFRPTLKLSEHDVVFPRHGFPLHKLVMQNSSDVKAKLFSWKSGFEVIEIFKKKLFIH